MTEKAYSDPKLRKQREGLIPAGRIAMPQDIAAMVLFLLSDAADCITGQTIFVDGGFSVSE